MEEDAGRGSKVVLNGRSDLLVLEEQSGEKQEEGSGWDRVDEAGATWGVEHNRDPFSTDIGEEIADSLCMQRTNHQGSMDVFGEAVVA